MPISKRIGGGVKSPSRIRIKSKPKVFEGELGEVLSEYRAGGGGHVRTGNESADFGRIGSGILSLDLALCGGFKMSRGVMIYGEKSTGKSTTSCLFIANAQKKFPNKVAVYMDVEEALTKIGQRS